MQTAMSTKDASAFGTLVGKYKMWWAMVDHDQWMHDFKERFDKKYQSEFWEAYKQEKPSFAEKQEQDRAMKDFEQAVGLKE